MSTNFECDCEQGFCESFAGNIIDIDLRKCDSEVRADIKVGKSKKRCVRVWGQIKDCEGHFVPNAQVKLLKSYYYHGKEEYEGIAHATTDCLGFYQFDVCDFCEHDKFRIIASKACAGKERVIRTDGICEPCDDDGYGGGKDC